eukprot:m.16259 g.16259  ORF g.16259 m.16259 type:complete len:806 (-) comp6848_c0_seq2:62-2479(-)
MKGAAMLPLIAFFFILCSFAIVSSSPIDPTALPKGTISIVSAVNTNLLVRHCSFQLFACHEHNDPADDFYFTIVPALNGAAGGISLQSANYPDHYIGLITGGGVEQGRLGLADASDPDDASFAVVPGLANSSLYSLRSLSTKPSFANTFVAINNQLSGVCAGEYSSPSSDVVLLATPSALAATWDLFQPPPPPPQNHTLLLRADTVTHELNRLHMGCHSDSGYTHQPRGFYSQMVFGEVFEFGVWPNRVGTGGTVELDAGLPFNGHPSLHIVQALPQSLGVANRGLGNEGLVFQKNRVYEGYLYAISRTPTTLIVQLQDYINNQVLATTSIFVSSEAATWTRFDFELTTTGATTCEGIRASDYPEVDCRNSKSAAHPCIRCGGQIVVLASGTSNVWINYVFVQPGDWGRFAGLPVLLDTVTWLQRMGVTAIRQGGTFTIDEYYVWKHWRGPAQNRSSLGAQWGASLISGWGPFEMIDLCNAAGFEPIITTSAKADPQDYADLVEYLFGDATTMWGGIRGSDGHPAPYRAKYFEIGNEEYPVHWVDQVTAMEEKLVELGMGGQFTYLFPDNGGPNAVDAARAEKLGLGDRLVSDIHVGAGGAMAEAEALFQRNPSYHQGAVNCETNSGTHDFKRALDEAADLNIFFNTNEPRMRARTASFCTERSGHFDAFDQGLIFFLPNMTWGQPPFYVHEMISSTWQPFAINFSVTPQSNTVSVSAAVSGDGKSLVVRYVNYGGPDSVTLRVVGMAVDPTVKVLQIQSDNLRAENTAAAPTFIETQQSTFTLGAGPLLLPAQSFTVLLFNVAS